MDSDVEMGDLFEDEPQQPLRWEKQDRAWDNLVIDKEGRLQSSITSSDTWLSISNKRKKELRGKVRGLIRSLVICLDLSDRGLAPTDLDGNRLSMFVRRLKVFISDFFDQNPLSQLAIVATWDSVAHVISPMSGSQKAHIDALIAMEQESYTGDPSVLHLLNTAHSLLKNSPYYATKSILLIFGALSTCDPEPIDSSLHRLVKARISVNIIGLGAQLYILSRIAKETSGTYFVPISSDHFGDLLSAAVLPPERVGAKKDSMPSTSLVRFGFATQTEDLPSFDPTELQRNLEKATPKYGALCCPGCGTRVFNIPVYCPVCQILLLSPAHVTRSLHHLHPIEDFTKAEINTCCHACNKPIIQNGVLCETCGSFFCQQCDKFIHECLQNCPGCLERPPKE